VRGSAKNVVCGLCGSFHPNTKMSYLDSDECRTAIIYSIPLTQDLIIQGEPTAVSLPVVEAVSLPVVEVQNKYTLQENIDLGAVSLNLVESGAEKYYLSTAIAYTNGYPHMGHAYEVCD
jgi:hypothetical protein